jgi:hypothetical protein
VRNAEDSDDGATLLRKEIRVLSFQEPLRSTDKDVRRSGANAQSDEPVDWENPGSPKDTSTEQLDELFSLL